MILPLRLSLCLGLESSVQGFSVALRSARGDLATRTLESGASHRYTHGRKELIRLKVNSKQMKSITPTNKADLWHSITPDAYYLGG